MSYFLQQQQDDLCTQRKLEGTCDNAKSVLGDGCMPGRLNFGKARQSGNCPHIQLHMEARLSVYAYHRNAGFIHLVGFRSDKCFI